MCTAAVLGTLPSVAWIYPVIILSGVLITASGVFGLTKFARLIPHPAMIGFLNGLAIIIAESQIHVFDHASALQVVLMAVSSLVVALIVYLLPRYTRVVPSSVAGIVTAVLIEYVLFRAMAGVETKTIGDLGSLSGDFVTLLFLRDDIDLPALSLDNVLAMLVPALWITLVAISEDVMTIEVVSEMTNTRPKTTDAEIAMVRQQIIAMGASNIVGGLLGTMGRANLA